MNATFTVRPADGLQPSANSSTLSVDLLYQQNQTAADGTVGDITDQTVNLQLDDQMSGSAQLPDITSASVKANVLSGDGSLIFSRTLQGNEQGLFQLIFTKDEITRCSEFIGKAPQDNSPSFCSRAMKLIPVKGDAVDFKAASVLIAPITDSQALAGTDIEHIIRIQGNKVVTVDITGKPADPLTQIEWTNGHVAIDGTISFTMIRQRTAGWLWWLSGDHDIAGFVPDDLMKEKERSFAVVLPKLLLPGKNLPTVTTQSDDCNCGTPIPINVTEKELVNNPGIYTEDPGAFCKPFSNPERVLSEKSFSVIARVSQPQIGAQSSVKSNSMRILSLDQEVSSAQTPASSAVGRFVNRIRAAVSGSATTATTAFAPAAKIDIGYDRLDEYKRFAVQLSSGRNQMDSNHPLQWEDDIAQYQSTTICLGNILDFRVRWRSNGYSLGTVAKTLTLAPRQTKRIQKIEWERSERAKRTEKTQLTDQENDSNIRDRDYQDHVSANLNEWASGSSHSDTEAVAAGIGFFAAGILGGIGGGAGSANSSSQQQGGRDTSASEHQRLRDAIRRHGDSLRKFESTVVNEVTEEENVTGTTEVIRNINYAHSLTVIYYQILRHLKVNTEFAGARQCIYIPFSIKPFNIARAYRWRESIQAAIRSQLYGRALRYLKDVATNFSTSDIPPGSRAQQPLTYVRGSIFVNLAIERPKDAPDGKYDDGKWNLFKHLLDTPALGIFGQLVQLVEGERDRYFQANYAPGIAARWTDNLQVKIGNNVIKIDSTLATRYQFNKGVRIDFVIPLESLSGLRRIDMQSIRVMPIFGLPPGSVANLTRMSITYSTARFQRSIQGQNGVDDMINPVTGQIELATVQFAPDSWESVDERLEIRRSVNQLIEHLNEHVEYYHKAIWWRMDRDRLLMMLDGFYVPFTNNVSIATVVDREPVGIIGNCLVYRIGAASFIEFGAVKNPTDLYNLYAEKQPVTDPILVSLPTDGLYAQTIMDDCNALEEHFGNQDWALNDKDPDLGTIDPSLLASRHVDTTASTTPTPFPTTIINLQNTPEAPAPSGLQGVLNAVTNPNAFRDFAGLAGTQANAQAALNTAAGLATSFGTQAASLELAKMAKSQEATKTADQKLATIQRAKDKGLTSPEEAASQAKEVLSSMNPDTPKGVAPHQDPAINSAIEAAKTVPGSSIEASNGEGGVKVTMGGPKEDSKAGPLIVEVNVTPALRAFGPGTNITGKTKLSVQGKNLNSGSQIKWSIPATETGKYTITQRITASGISEVEISGIQPGVTNIDVEAIDGGVVVASVKYQLSIPQFITINDNNASFNQFISDNTLQAIQKNIIDEAKQVVHRIYESNANVRLLWASDGSTKPAHVPLNMVTKVSILNTDPSGQEQYGVSGPGPSAAGVGDRAFDEVVEIFPASYLASATASVDVDQTTNQLVSAIMSIQASDPNFEAWEIKIFGRLLGETLSHEMFHCLLPIAFSHNVDAGGNEFDSVDIMDAGAFRSFRERTGIAALDASFPPDQILAQLIDNGIGIINTITDATLGRNLTHLHTNFPITI